MTYATYLQRDDVAFIHYVIIGGLPYVFSHVEQPVAWSLGSSIQWSKTQIYFRDGGQGQFDSVMQSVSEKIDEERGTTVSGNFQVEMLYDPEDGNSLWVQLVADPKGATWRLDPIFLIEPSDTTMVFLGPVPAQNNVLHFGLESVIVGTGAGQSRTVTRGAFNSVHQWYGPRGGELGQTTGGIIEGTSWPRTWRGRPISVWRAACEFDKDGMRVPLSTSIQGDHDEEIFNGTIYELDWDVSRPGRIVLSCQSLDQYMERSIITRSRVYRPGPPTQNNGWVYVEDNGPHLVEFSIGENNYTGVTGASSLSRGGVINLTSTGQPFAGGKLVNVHELMDEILKELHALTVTGGADGIYFTWSLWSDPDSDEGPKIRLGAVIAEAAAFSPLLDDIVFRTTTSLLPDRSALKAAGCSEDLVITPETSDFGVNYWEPLPQMSYGTGAEPVPHYYLSKSQTRVYWHGNLRNATATTGDPPENQGTTSLNGETDGVAVRFGKHEVLTVNFRSSGNLLFDSDFPEFTYATIVKRGRVFTGAQEISVPTDKVGDENFALHVGLLFDNHSVMDVLRWLGTSNGDSATTGLWTGGASSFNVLPEGFGAAIPGSYWDNNAFEIIKLERQPETNGWYFEDSTSLREIFGQVGLTYGLNFLTTLGTGTPGDLAGRRRISIKEVFPLSENATPSHSIDASWTDTTNSPASHDRNERSVINRVELEFDWDPLEEKYQSKDNSATDAASIANYGPSRALRIRIPWLHGFGSVKTLIIMLAARLFQNRGRPHAVYTIPFVSYRGWAVRLGDFVSLTHKSLPDYIGGGYGITSETLRVVGITQQLGPQAGNLGSLDLTWQFRCTTRTWVPNLKIASLDTGTVYNVDANEFALSESGLKDIEHYAVGWIVRAYIPGEDVFENNVVDALDVANNKVTLNTAITLTPLADVVIDFRDYDDSIDSTQETFTFACDSDTLLNTNGSSVTRAGARYY